MESPRETKAQLEAAGKVSVTVVSCEITVLSSCKFFFMHRVLLEGFSTFQVNSDGLICLHKMDKVHYIHIISTVAIGEYTPWDRHPRVSSVIRGTRAL